MVTRAPEPATAGIAPLLESAQPPARVPGGPGAGIGRTLPRAFLPRRIATVLIAAAIAALAFWIRYRLLTNAGGLGGVGGYDDGVYYAAADALVHGRLPYRDFLFLQPPGIAIVLAPFAWLGSVTSDPHGVVVARLAFLALGATNAVLVAAICRRFGPAAAVVGGVGYAVFFPAAYAERSMLLEPVGSFGILAALLLTQGRPARSRVALIAAGALLGLAVATKIWYLVPAVIIAILLRDRRALVLAGGFAAALTATVLPFLAAAPNAFVQQVVLDQLGRPEDTAVTPMRRLASMLALRVPLEPTPHQAQLVLVKLVGLAVAALLLAALALALPEARRYVLLAVAAVVVLLASPSYFTHYGDLLTPALAITIGAGVQRLAQLLRRPPLQVLLVTAALLGFALVNRYDDTARTSEPVPAAALRPAAARVTGCITSDDPLVLAELGVLSRDLKNGCPVRIDVTGYTYGPDRMSVDGIEVPRLLNSRWQRDVTGYLLSGQAVIVHRRATQLSAPSGHAVRHGPVLARSGNWVLHAVERP
jgi:alpha-1,2-mannosyltransferase